jgi:YHS domain-containing protein
MKHLLVITLALLFAISFSFSLVAQEKKTETIKKVESTEVKAKDSKTEVQKTTEATVKKVVDPKPVNSVCPVSGEEIDSEITATYNGKTYAVCCKSCLKKFNKDPEKYVAKLSEDGKSLKKIK